MAEFTEYTGEILDRLGLIEIRSPSYIKIPTVDLYEACREVVGQPLSYVAAKGWRGAAHGSHAPTRGPRHAHQLVNPCAGDQLNC